MLSYSQKMAEGGFLKSIFILTYFRKKVQILIWPFQFRTSYKILIIYLQEYRLTKGFNYRSLPKKC